jgi:ATP-binding cassette subfamily B multidrug efflux pump
MSDKKIVTPRKAQFGGRGRGPGAMGRPVEKAKDFKGTLKRLVKYLKPQVPKLTIVLVFAIVSTIFTIKTPKIMGNALNDLSYGFIAKSTVNSVSKMQTEMVPKLKDMLSGLDTAQQTAVSKTKDAVKKQFDEKINEQKQKAYETAKQKAGEAVEKQFNATINSKKQQAYATAKQKADEMAEKKFNAAINEQKESAYKTAVNQAKSAAKAALDASYAKLFPGVSDFTTIPGYSEALTAAQKKAADSAKAAVDAKFKAQQATFDSQLAQAKQKAEAAAVAAVDAQFKKQQSMFDSQLAQAKQKAEAAAVDAVDTQFKKQQSTFDSQLEKAQDEAAKKVKDEVNKKALEKANLTQEQYDAVKEIASLPNVKDVKTNDEKADIIQKLFDLSNQLPDSMNKSGKISKSDFDKGVGYVRTYGGAIPFDAIWKTLVYLLALYALSALFQFGMQYIMSGVAQKTVFTLRKEVDEKITRLPLRYFDSHPNGDTLSRMTNDIDTISSTLQQSLTQLITAVLQLVGYVWMMVTISWKLTLIVIATLPLYIVVTLIITKYSQRFYAAQQKHLGELSGHTEEMFTGHTIVKAFGHEEDSIAKFKGINKNLYGVGWKAQFMSGILMPMMNFIGNIGYVLIAVVGGIFVTKSYLGLGDIVAFISYSKSFSQPIIQTANIANIIQSTIACAERVFELLDEKDEEPDKKDSVVISQPQGNIIFDHVKFRYNDDEPLIEDMNLDIKQGETIAIVGPTGAGKTTLVNLLMRFYEIRGGKITFDNVDIKDINRGNLRKMFGMVLQDTWLFNGTIHDNIAYGNQNATEQQIIAAAKAAHADRFIRSLPDGYNTVLNEEASNISQGQKQLLTIARAILADPAVLILDEATSSVDTRTEVLIQKAMNKLMEGRTSFIIAHRLSTIRDAKMILVMNHGNIIECGNHKQLLAKGGFYADLYNSQFAGNSI